MESKLNTLALETYSSAFTDRVANDFFARHEKINGEQILKLTPVQQVNLFVIKNLFEAWQQEASRLRSPYFNYNHPKVQEAQKVYMNTLSRHIAIGEPELKGLLQKSVQDALHLLFSPVSYIGKALKGTAGKPDTTAEILRYIKINQTYAKETKEILNRQNVTDENWIRNLQSSLQQLEHEHTLQPEAPTPYIQQFSQILSLTSSEILRDEEFMKEKEEENTDFFSSITGTLEEEDDTPAIQPNESETTEPDQDIPAAAENASRHATFRREEPDFTNKSPQINITQPAEREEKGQENLNDRLRAKTEQKPIHQSHHAPAERPNLATAHARKRNGNIRSVITLNQRFMFTNELFGGDTQAFNQALDKLDGFQSYEEAYQFTFREYARQYNWEEDSEASQEFLQILQSRYA